MQVIINKKNKVLHDSFINKSLIIIKLEALFNSFLEDDFLGYSFYNYGLSKSLKTLYYYFFQNYKFQLLLQQHLEEGELLCYVNFNEEVIKKINTFIEGKHKIILISNKKKGVVDAINNYLNLGESIGNRKNENKDINDLLNEYLKKTEGTKEYIFFSDEILINPSKKANLLLQTGPFYKVFFNFLIHKNIDYIENTYINNNHLLLFIKWIQKKKLSHLLGIFAIPIVIAVEIKNLITIFFHKILIFIILFGFFYQALHFIEYKFLSFKIIISVLVESNNILNFYKLISASFPVKNNIFKRKNDSKNYYREKFLKSKILKTYGSLRFGIFIFLLNSLVYFNNWYLLINQIFFIFLFLAIPIKKIKFWENYSWIFLILNSSSMFFII